MVHTLINPVISITSVISLWIKRVSILLSELEDKVYISFSWVSVFIKLLHCSHISGILIEKLNGSHDASSIGEDNHHYGEQNYCLDDFDEFIKPEFDLQDVYFKGEAGNKVNSHIDESHNSEDKAQHVHLLSHRGFDSVRDCQSWEKTVEYFGNYQSSIPKGGHLVKSNDENTGEGSHNGLSLELVFDHSVYRITKFENRSLMSFLLPKLSLKLL